MEPLLAWVGAHPNWAGFIVFLLSFAESVAIVGVLVPGVVLLFGVGALIGSGHLHFLPVWLWAVAGAIVGDGLSYWLGRRYRERLTRLWPLSRHPELIEKGQDFFARHGVNSVALGRFVGPIRAVIPLIAGMAEMRPLTFFIANVLSALAWALVYLAPGVVFGASLGLAAGAASRLVALLLALVALGWLLVWTIRRLLRIAEPLAARLVSWLLRRVERHQAFHGIAAALADPRHPEFRGLAQLALLLTGAVLSFGLLLSTLHADWWQGSVNEPLRALMQSLRTPAADRFFTWLTMFADWQVILPMQLGLLAWFWFSRQRRVAAHWLAACAYAWISVPLLKYSLRIPRPPNTVDGIGPWSFPSGHTLHATVTYGFLAFLIAGSLPSARRGWIYAPTFLLIGLIGLSRLYLGVHWFSDVLASLALGLLWIALLGMALRHHHTPPRAWRRNLAVGLILPLAALALHTALHWNREFAAYRLHPTRLEMPLESWRRDGWRTLPRWREDLRQHGDQPLQIQYAGRLDHLQQWLRRQGWRSAERLNGHNALRLLSPSSGIDELPLIPQVHAGEHEELALVKPLDDERRLVLRFWDSHLRLQPGALPVWLGSLSRQRRIQRFHLLNFGVTIDHGRAPAARQALLDALRRSGCCHIETHDSVVLIEEKQRLSEPRPRARRKAASPGPIAETSVTRPPRPPK